MHIDLHICRAAPENLCSLLRAAHADGPRIPMCCAYLHASMCPAGTGEQAGPPLNAGLSSTGDCN